MSNGEDISIAVPFRIVSLDEAMVAQTEGTVTLLSASISPALRKVAGARWLLQSLEENMRSEGRALLFLESLVTTLRSITFVLQKMGAGVDGFEEWYSSKVTAMREDPQLRWLVDTRNAAEKEGLVLAEYGPDAIVRIHLDGSTTTEVTGPVFRLDGFHSDDILADLGSALGKLSELVDEAHWRFFGRIGQKHMHMHIAYLQEGADGSWSPVPVSDLELGILGPIKKKSE